MLCHICTTGPHHVDLHGPSSKIENNLKIDVFLRQNPLHMVKRITFSDRVTTLNSLFLAFLYKIVFKKRISVEKQPKKRAKLHKLA